MKHRKNTLETGEILFLSWNERQARATVFSDVSGTEKVGFGRVREFPRLEFSGTGMPGNFPTRIFRELNMPGIS